MQFQDSSRKRIKILLIIFKILRIFLDRASSLNFYKVFYDLVKKQDLVINFGRLARGKKIHLVLLKILEEKDLIQNLHKIFSSKNLHKMFRKMSSREDLHKRYLWDLILKKISKTIWVLACHSFEDLKKYLSFRIETILLRLFL